MAWFFTEIADGFDRLVHDDEVFIDDWGTRAAGDYLRHGGVGDWLELAGASAAYAGFKFSSTVAKGFVDVLRIGDGVKKGGWGYGQDALRALVVAGPALRGVRSLAGLVAEVDFNANLGNCAPKCDRSNSCTRASLVNCPTLSAPEQACHHLCDRMLGSGVPSVPLL